MGEIQHHGVDPRLLLAVIVHKFEYGNQGGNHRRDKNYPSQNALEHGNASSLLIRHEFPLFKTFYLRVKSTF